jgi:hypothetical protein
MELHRHLLAVHQLTDIQRVEQLFSLPYQAAQKPSKLLVEMLSLCPRGQENNAFFNCLFLNKLPRELRILLSEADMADKQALGARADLFATHNHKQAHDVVAALDAVSLLEPEGKETTMATVHPGASSGKHGGGSGQRGGSWRGKKKPGVWWRQWQRRAGVPHGVPHGAGQAGEWAVLQPFLLWGQG